MTSPGSTGIVFLPDAPVSRGEAAVYIWNMEGQPSAPSHSFVDVTNENQNTAVSWMSHNQITTGTTPTTFEPDTTLTRAHLVTFLHRLIGEPEAPAHPFIDVHASWQQNSVSWASHTGITTGTSPTTFEPDTTLTRAHFVTFLWRYKGKPDVTVDPDTPSCDPSSTDETDTNETDTNETDTNETDTNETDTNETDTNETDTNETDTNEATDTNETDTDEATDTNRVFTAVSVGSDHSCAIDTNNKIACWGRNDHGQASAPRGEFTMVSAGHDHSCAIHTNGTIECWGENHVGETDAPDGEFTTVSTASFHSCGYAPTAQSNAG